MTPPTSELLTRVAGAELFKALDPALLQTLGPELEWIPLAEDEILFRQGDLGDALYVVLTGRLQVFVSNDAGQAAVTGEVPPGQTVGEMALLTGTPRVATVQAVEKAELVKLSRAAFDRLAATHPQTVEQMGRLIVRRLQRNELAITLPKLFGHLDETVLQDIEARLDWVRLPRGGKLMSLGDESDSIYIVVRGRLHATIPDREGQEQVVERIGAGESVGEMGVLSGEKRSANVYAVRETELVRFSRAQFDALVAQHPWLIRPLTQQVLQRLLRQMRPQPQAPSFTNIAIIPTGPGVPLTEFTQQLATALTPFGAPLRLTSSLVDSALGVTGIAHLAEDDPQKIRLIAWLEEREHAHRFVIYEADPTLSGWTRRCLRQADQVLLVGQAGTDPALGEIEAALEASITPMTDVRRALVLLHRDGQQLPSGTLAWLAARRVELHHHVRWGRVDDFARLARFVAGRAVGLTLSGGGARGFAHLGAIRAITEAGIPIDMIGGTSMGAVVGGLYALGWDLKTIAETIRRIFSPTVYDVTLPLASLLAGHRLVKRFDQRISSVQIEDLWLPYFCVSSNLTRATPVIHRSGPLRRGMRASGSLPGLFPPVVWEGGDLLVDGAMLNNLPVDVMRSFCGHGTVLAVDVSPPVDLVNNTPYGDSLSGWQILWSRLNPFIPNITLPGIASILNRAGQLSSIAQRKRLIEGIADLYIPMPVEEVGLLEFEAADKLIALGYQQAREYLAAWLATEEGTNASSAP